MAHGHVARNAVQIPVVKRLGNQAHAGVNADRSVLGRRYPRGFLSPVLQGEQADGRKRRAMRSRTVYAYDPALFARVVKGDRVPLAE